MITQKQLKELLDYNPLTGKFTWRVFRGGGAPEVGEQAGSVNGQGYREIKLRPKIYEASRLAVLWMTGRWPQHTVDHINQSLDDNRWANLREASWREQCRNRRGWSKYGFKGVKTDRRNPGFSAWIKIDGKAIYLGRRPTAAEAHELYRQAAAKRFGAFARTNHIGG